MEVSHACGDHLSEYGGLQIFLGFVGFVGYPIYLLV